MLRKPVEKWIPELSLLKTGQESLSNTGWLTDSITDASQRLLQKKPISGFQSVTSGLAVNFKVYEGPDMIACSDRLLP